MSAGWSTIESDAGVFTYLLSNLGVRDIQFEELLTLEPSALRQLSPIYGLIFLFKYPTNEPPSQNPGKPHDGEYDYAAAEELFFASQVIQNACGTQALLSCLLNKDGTAPPAYTSAPAASSSDSSAEAQTIDIGPSLTSFKDFTTSLPSDMRGEALSNSELIRTVHNSFARSSPFVDETVRQASQDTEDVFHFIAYTPIGGVLYELDGLQPAPISHGDCGSEEVFCERVVEVLRRRMGRYESSEIRFNLLGMCRDLRIRAREMGDQEAVEAEEAKRRGWLWENALRRHNFLGFVKGVLEGVVGGKVREGEGRYEEWVEGAKERTRKRVEARRKGAGQGVDERELMDVGA